MKTIYRFDPQKRISDSDCTAKKYIIYIKEKKAIFDMPLKENNTPTRLCL